MSRAWRISAQGQVQPPSEQGGWTSDFENAADQWQRGCPSARTSGSTGAPVEHRFTVESVRASAASTAAHFLLDGPHRREVFAWSALPAAGTGGRMMVWRALALGWDLTVTKPALALEVPVAPSTDGRYHFAVATPLQAEHLMASGQLNRFAMLLLGGAPLSPDLESALEQAAAAADCRIFHGFGMTETLTHVATRPLGTLAYTALPGVEARATETGALVLDVPLRGVKGLVTRDAVRLHFGDAHTPDSDEAARQFYWLGRMDDVINSAGLKFHPAALERRWSPLLSDVLNDRKWYVTGRPDDSLGDRVTLVVEGKPHPDLATAVLEVLKDEGHARPRSVEFQDVFEETASGKVRRI